MRISIGRLDMTAAAIVVCGRYQRSSMKKFNLFNISSASPLCHNLYLLRPTLYSNPKRGTQIQACASTIMRAFKPFRERLNELCMPTADTYRRAHHRQIVGSLEISEI